MDLLRDFFNEYAFTLSIFRDEEKKMGTLVKEDFGRPDRSNTMVRSYDILDKIISIL